MVLDNLVTSSADVLEDALAGPYEDIPVHPEAEDLDYEVCAWGPIIMLFSSQILG